MVEKFLKLESRTDSKIYKIRLGEFHFLSREGYGTIYITKKGADFYAFMVNHVGENFNIIGTPSILSITANTPIIGNIGVTLTTLNKNGETISANRFIYNGADTDTYFSLKIARCFLAIDTDSNSIFAIPSESKTSFNRYTNVYTPFFEPAPYTMGINDRISLSEINRIWTFRESVSAVLQGTAIACHSFAENFTSYSAIEQGTDAGSVAYCALRNFSNIDPNNPTIPPIDTEYSGFPGDPSSPSGGNGEMTDTNDETLLAPPDYANVKYFTRIYKLNAGQIDALYRYLWSSDFITNLPKLFSDPFSAIVAMQALPVDAPSTTDNIYIGSLDSGVDGEHVTSYYNTIDLGEINITEFWQSFLDYQPYTRLKLYLPYIGIVDLPTDQFMNQSIAIKYRIDVLSGSCVAVVSNSTNIVCQFTGNCATKMPISANDHASILANSLVGLTAVAGNVAVGNVAGAVASSANVMLGLKEKIQISGSLATNHGILVNSKPYVMIERPTSDIPSNYATLKGYTSNISLKLSDCSGFTKISDIKLNGISATDEEKTEILSLLQTGVYM